MATTAPVASAPVADDLGLDREFLLKMASWPVIALGFTAAAWLGHQVSPYSTVVLLCVGMIVAAVIDGLAFKVPNWLTIPLILSGWGIGLLHDFGVAVGPGPVDAIYREGAHAIGGGISSALLGTALGFIMLFPALFIGGMGQGDVKMQMGFGSWVGAMYGSQEGPYTIAIAVCCGMLVGGAMGLVMMLLRGNLHKNVRNFREIFKDFQILASAGPKYAAERARTRRPSWHRLPYGIPLCVGFVGYIVYLYATVA